MFSHKLICSDQNCEQTVLICKNKEMKMNVKKIFQLLLIKICCLKEVTVIKSRLKMVMKGNKLMTLFVLIALFCD